MVKKDINIIASHDLDTPRSCLGEQTPGGMNPVANELLVTPSPFMMWRCDFGFQRVILRFRGLEAERVLQPNLDLRMRKQYEEPDDRDTPRVDFAVR